MHRFLIILFIVFIYSCQYVGDNEIARFDSGEIKQEWAESNGVKHGVLKEYYKSGELRMVQNWVEGKLTGKEISYHGNGQIAQSFNYRNNLKVGKAEVFLPEGQLIEVQYYDSVGILLDYEKYNAQGIRNNEMRLIIAVDKDTLNIDEKYSGVIRLGNITNDYYKKGTLIIATQWNANGVPADTLLALKSRENYYPFKISPTNVGENIFIGCIYYQIPLDTIDGVLATQRCIEGLYNVKDK
jgi:hypothetical protein